MEITEIVFAVVVGVAVVYLVMGRSREQYAKGFKMAAVWLVILLIVTAGVIYWPEFKNTKFYASIVPGSAVIHNDGSMEFSRAVGGHFHIDAVVNGENITFMVDTGATDIVLSKTDAKKIGLHPDNLRYDKLYRTANGMTRGASVRLDNIAVGSYQTGGIYASVNEGEMDSSLLGLAFLNRMKSYRIEGDRLILNP